MNSFSNERVTKQISLRKICSANPNMCVCVSSSTNKRRASCYIGLGNRVKTEKVFIPTDLLRACNIFD